MKFCCWVSGIPQTKGSWRSLGKGKPMIPDNRKSKPWEQVVRLALEEKRPAGWDRFAALAVEMRFLLPRPASVSAKKRPYPKVKPDADKLVRCVLDALMPNVAADDGQVCDCTARKCYAEDGDCGAWIEVVNMEAEA